MIRVNFNIYDLSISFRLTVNRSTLSTDQQQQKKLGEEDKTVFFQIISVFILKMSRVVV